MIDVPWVYPPPFDPEQGASLILSRSYRGWACVWGVPLATAAGRLSTLSRLGLARRVGPDWVLAEGCHLDGLQESAVIAPQARVTP